MRSRKAWARASRLSSGSRVPRGLPDGLQASGSAALSVIRSPLKRLVLGVTEASGGLLRLGAVMIPLGGFRLLVRGFSVGIAGYQIRVALGVTELFWERFGFSGGTPGFGGLGFSSGFGRRGLRNFFRRWGCGFGSSGFWRLAAWMRRSATPATPEPDRG